MRRNVHQRRQILRGWTARASDPAATREQPVRGIVGQQHHAFRIRGEDRGRTALHQDFQLLFGVAPRFDLAFDLLSGAACASLRLRPTS